MAQAVLNKANSAYNSGMQSPIFQVISQNPKLPISKIEYKGLKLEFFKPYIMTVKIEDKFLVHENPKLNMVIRGETIEELVEQFFGVIHDLWAEIVQVDENTLHPSAIKFKNYLLTLLEEI